MKALKSVDETVFCKKKNPQKRLSKAIFKDLVLAGAEGLEPSARGFGDHCSTN